MFAGFGVTLSSRARSLTFFAGRCGWSTRHANRFLRRETLLRAVVSATRADSATDI